MSGVSSAFSSFSGVRLTNSGATSTTTATDTVLTWDTETYDTNAYHSTVTDTHKMTAPFTGYYRIGAKISWAQNGTGYRGVAYRVNSGSTIYQTTVAPPSDNACVTSFAADIFLNAGDYWDVVVKQSSGGALNVDTASVASMSFIGA